MKPTKTDVVMTGPTDPEQRRAWKNAMFSMHYGSTKEEIARLMSAPVMPPLSRWQRIKQRLFSRPIRPLCDVGIHLRVLEGGGMMQDALMCVDCGRDKYPEVFGVAVHKRQWPGMIDPNPEARLTAWNEAEP